MTEAYFITLEGIDGSGKSSLLQLLSEHLQGLGRQVLLTFEPGGSALGRHLRPLLLEKQNLNIDVRSEALLFAAERAAHVNEVIRPALLAEHIVLCDRFGDSTLAYQGGGRGLNLGFLQQLNQFATGGLEPDLTLYLDLPLCIARARQGQQPDRLEQEDEAFYRRISQTYRQLAVQEPLRIKTIDASQSLEQVMAAALKHLPSHLRGPAKV